MRILVLTPVWKRPEVVRVFADAFVRSKYDCYWDLGLLPIISPEDPYYSILVNIFWNYESTYRINKPLGAKKNKGLEVALLRKWDYLLELGSDNVMHPKIFDYYKPYIDRGDLMFGFTEGYVCEPKTKRCIWTKNRWNDGMCQGAGRMIHRSVVEKTIYKMGSLWEDKSESGLDTESRKRINNAYGRTTNDPLEKVVKAPHPMVLDIKTDTNLWPMVWFNKWMERHPENFEEVDYETITKEFGVWESLK